MKMNLDLLLALLSLVLYAFSPKGVDVTIITCDSVLFLIGVFYILKNEWKEGFRLSFNTLFLLSFFFVSFSFALFIVNSEEMFDSFRKLNSVVLTYIDTNYITRATSLCLVAFCFYFIGYKRTFIVKHGRKNLDVEKKYVRKSTLIVSFFWILSIMNMFFSMGSIDEESSNLTDRAFIYEIYKCSLAVALVLSGIYHEKKIDRKGLLSFVKFNKCIIIQALFLALFYLYIGDRGTAIAIALLLICSCSFYYYRFKFYQILTIGLIGAVVLFSIRQTRHSENSIRESGLSSFSGAASESLADQNVLFLFADLISACQELYYGYAINEEIGLQYPEQIILLPLYPFPFLPNIGSSIIFNKPLKEVTGVKVYNDYLEKKTGLTASFGKHCVSDIYIKWGIIGVIFFFYIFGAIIGYLTNKRTINLLSACLYVTLVASSLYLPRSSLIDVIRILTYTYVILFIIKTKFIIKKIT